MIKRVCHFLVSWLLLCPAMLWAQDNPLTSAHWIRQGFVEDSLRAPVMYKKTFTIAKPVKSATLWITAHGIYESSINGKRNGDAYFAPGWTNYNKRLCYQSYEVGSLLQKGANDLQIMVGEGWWRGVMGNQYRRDLYGKDAAILCRMVVRYKDGTNAEIVSDSSWQSGTGVIQRSDIYNGELIDYTKITKKWYGVNVEGYAKNMLVPTVEPSVKKHEVFQPVQYLTTPKGEQVVDFGQNLAGWVELQVKGKKGDTIVVEHAEVLDKNGNFYTDNLRKAKATDSYVLCGTGIEHLAPHFTYHGFRYIRIKGVDARTTHVQAVAVYSDLRPTGTFECSDSLVNQLYKNISWSLKSNFVDLPTDCPQRNERLGWTADAQAFLPTAAYMFDVNNFYEKWYQDLQSEQYANGVVPPVVPNSYYQSSRFQHNGIAGWGDAATIVPLHLFQVYGDTVALRTSYPTMKKWVDHIAASSPGNLWTVGGFGDWLAPGDSTSLPFIDQCFWYYSTNKLIEAARILGYTADVEFYTAMAGKIQQAFLSEYVSADGRLTVHTQTAHVLALHFGLLPAFLKEAVVGQLVQLIMDAQMHLSTGFIGTPYLMETLSDNGYNDIAYALLLQKNYPSWLYPLSMGATTIWERWDGIQPDSTVLPLSFNHYAFGSVAEWLYAYAAGIRPVAAGYRKLLIAPQPGPGLTWVHCSYASPAGMIVSNWQVVGSKVEMQVTIPKGASATIVVPGKGRFEVGGGVYHYEGLLSLNIGS